MSCCSGYPRIFPAATASSQLNGSMVKSERNIASLCLVFSPPITFFRAVFKFENSDGRNHQIRSPWGIRRIGDVNIPDFIYTVLFSIRFYFLWNTDCLAVSILKNSCHEHLETLLFVCTYRVYLFILYTGYCQKQEGASSGSQTVSPSSFLKKKRISSEKSHIS